MNHFLYSCVHCKAGKKEKEKSLLKTKDNHFWSRKFNKRKCSGMETFFLTCTTNTFWAWKIKNMSVYFALVELWVVVHIYGVCTVVFIVWKYKFHSYIQFFLLCGSIFHSYLLLYCIQLYIGNSIMYGTRDHRLPWNHVM